MARILERVGVVLALGGIILAPIIFVLGLILLIVAFEKDPNSDAGTWLMVTPVYLFLLAIAAFIPILVGRILGDLLIDLSKKF